MSKIKAVVESNYPEGIATAIAGALQADNHSSKETRIVTHQNDGLVRTEIESTGLEKLLPVIDDLLFCQSICERTLSLTEMKSH